MMSAFAKRHGPPTSVTQACRELARARRYYDACHRRCTRTRTLHGARHKGRARASSPAPAMTRNAPAATTQTRCCVKYNRISSNLPSLRIPASFPSAGSLAAKSASTGSWFLRMSPETIKGGKGDPLCYKRERGKSRVPCTI